MIHCSIKKASDRQDRTPLVLKALDAPWGPGLLGGTGPIAEDHGDANHIPRDFFGRPHDVTNGQIQHPQQRNTDFHGGSLQEKDETSVIRIPECT